MQSFSSLSHVRSQLNAGALSLTGLVQHYLQNIEAQAHLNIYTEVYAEESLSEAARIEEKLKQGTAGRLAGMVLSLKDVLCHQDHTLQAGSNILKGFKSQFTASAVQRLLNEDAIIIGRTNCDEFAMGSSNENSAFGPVRNPTDPERVPGGSSGGSAAAVVADTCLASLGSDTGGSVRQPAAFCGIIGLKPTYARISRYGLAAYASSFDCIGPLTRSLEDAALLLELMAGDDGHDSTVSRREVPAYSTLLEQATESAPRRIAYLREGLESEAVDPEIRAAMQSSINRLKAAGHTVVPVEFAFMDYILPTYYILTMAEASSNLSRYDGVRYGYRSPNTTDMESMYKKTRSEGFGAEVKKRIMLGTFVLSANYYDAYFTKAQRVRRLIQQQTEALLNEHDFVLMPAAPSAAFKIGEKTQDPIAMFLGDVFTVQANVAGVPSVALPVGTTQAGLPVGLQFMSKSFSEADLLCFSKHFLSLN